MRTAPKVTVFRRGATRRLRAMEEPAFVYQFLIALSETDPLVWRRLQVPSTYTFWDLHVAIQDAMGWHDCHLHRFELFNKSDERLTIGLPVDDEFATDRCEPGWLVNLSSVFEPPGEALPARYLYDFGDDWSHAVVCEGPRPADPSASYPRCVAGARRGPPEDCGGPHGYEHFLEAIANPRHPEHTSLLRWVGGSYDPNDFDAAAVIFDDPAKRRAALDPSR